MLSRYLSMAQQNTKHVVARSHRRTTPRFLTTMSRQTQPKTTLLNALALGAGSFARAIEVIHKDSGEPFVLKTYRDRSEKARSSFKRECILAMELAIRDLAPMIFVCDLGRKWIIVERVIPLDQWLRTQKTHTATQFVFRRVYLVSRSHKTIGGLWSRKSRYQACQPWVETGAQRITYGRSIRHGHQLHIFLDQGFARTCESRI